MVRHPVLGEMTPDRWLMLRMTLIEADMAPEGWFSAADIVRTLNIPTVTERTVRDLFATFMQNHWMEAPIEKDVSGENTRFYRLTPLGVERINALFAQ